MVKILIAGCGHIGLSLAKSLAKQAHTVTGLRRNPPSQIVPQSENLSFFKADISSEADLFSLDKSFDYVFFILAPDERSSEHYQVVYENGLNNLLSHFSQHKPRWFFISSTSVYGQNNGEWVDEDSVTHPVSETAKFILNAEQQVLNNNQLNIVIRYSGIYGPGRERLLNKVKQRPEIQNSPSTYTNRIHQDDCVRVLEFLLEQSLAGASLAPIYLASDDEPVSLSDIMIWMAQKLNVDRPILRSKAHDAPQNKRCVNARLKALGFSFTYPSYKEGYLPMIDAIKQN